MTRVGLILLFLVFTSTAQAKDILGKCEIYERNNDTKEQAKYPVEIRNEISPIFGEEADMNIKLKLTEDKSLQVLMVDKITTLTIKDASGSELASTFTPANVFTNLFVSSSNLTLHVSCIR